MAHAEAGRRPAGRAGHVTAAWLVHGGRGAARSGELARLRINEMVGECRLLSFVYVKPQRAGTLMAWVHSAYYVSYLLLIKSRSYLLFIKNQYSTNMVMLGSIICRLDLLEFSYIYLFIAFYFFFSVVSRYELLREPCLFFKLPYCLGFLSNLLNGPWMSVHV